MRISPELRNMLWSMKQELGYTKMEEVVLHLISNQRAEAA